MTSPTPQVYASVDWISLHSDDPDRAPHAWDKASALAVEQEAAGNDRRPWQANGFVGWSSRHLRWGRKGEAVALELSGDLADRYWHDFAQLATSCSRLDRAVTVVYPHPVHDLAVTGYQASPVALVPGRPPISKTLLQGDDGGQTLYVGRMGGRRFGRLYDKSVESRGEYPPNCWRWEVQERSPHSGIGCSDLRRCDDVPRAIRAYVHHFFNRRGVVPWFLSDGAFVPGIRRRPRSDLSRRFDWWRGQVSPGVRRSLNGADRNAIANALGLMDGYLG